MNVVERLNKENEKVWTRIGTISQSIGDEEKTLYSFENVLKHNHFNVNALLQIARVYKSKKQFSKAVEYYNRILNVENNNSEIWSELGHCFLMLDQLQKSYSAYHQSLYKAKLQNKSKYDSRTWYGIGILYERFGYLDNAEECFRSILQSDEDFVLSNEIFFRLGMIYKMKKKYKYSLESFEYIVENPPKPLTKADIFYQIGHIYEVMKDFNKAKGYYENSLKIDPKHSSVLQQLGWLYFRDDMADFKDLGKAIEYFQASIDSCSENGQTWYLLGRSYMKQKKFKKAFDAYQQSVFRDGRNPLFWCSIGILYFQINQQQDALDAYSKAIKLNDRISEVWYNLGTLYESCNQLDDALDAYKKASELKPNDPNIKKKLIIHKIPQSIAKKVINPNPITNIPLFGQGRQMFQKKLPVVPPPSAFPFRSMTPLVKIPTSSTLGKPQKLPNIKRSRPTGLLDNLPNKKKQKTGIMPQQKKSYPQVINRNRLNPFFFNINQMTNYKGPHLPSQLQNTQLSNQLQNTLPNLQSQMNPNQLPSIVLKKK